MRILFAIILSMSLTFALDCALLHTNAHNSFVQQFIDMSRDFNLMLRCMYNGDHSKTNRDSKDFITLYLFL
jgi:hypothetical protein